MLPFTLSACRAASCSLKEVAESILLDQRTWFYLLKRQQFKDRLVVYLGKMAVSVRQAFRGGI